MTSCWMEKTLGERGWHPYGGQESSAWARAVEMVDTLRESGRVVELVG